AGPYRRGDADSRPRQAARPHWEPELLTRVLFLTDNPTLGGTIRILQSWLVLGRESGSVAGYVTIPPGSEFRRWLAAHDVPYVHDTLPAPDRRWPFPALQHGL